MYYNPRYAAISVPCIHLFISWLLIPVYDSIIWQSVPITTDVVSSNLDQGEVYNIIW
jgi:hypothetical protein